VANGAARIVTGGMAPATIAQDEATPVVFGVPRAAIERGAVDGTLLLHRLAGAILARTGLAATS
jgi:chemotaxis response regulator CheB